MSQTRIIAKLDVKPPNVVKPIHFEGLKIIGDPVDLARKYYDQGADELIYIDIVSSLYQRSILFSDITSFSSDLFLPICVGGGVKTTEDFSKLIQNGADKVAINTYALQENPNIIDRSAKLFGSQSVVVSIEAKRIPGDWECYSDCGRIPSGKIVKKWAKELEQRGAGEILLQSVDKDGAKNGFDIELANEIVSLVNIPVTVSSGAGSLKDIKLLFDEVRPSGIAFSSVLHSGELTINEIKEYINR